ncbi:MAG TPA: efflux RND transporter periplasmic adaptor subunit [Vicinamibacterales bacterium]|nr:efflux RND transporter periplasmic adaptor subunit [Vicinamibacterales bacterium]
MTPLSFARALAVGVMILATDCSKTETKTPVPDSASKTAAPGMAGMPGMAADERPSADTNGQVAFSAAQIQHGGVKWGVVTAGTTSGSATVPGEVTPNEDRTVRLGAPARGRIVSVLVRPGDRVSAGESLVTLQSPEAGMAQSDVAKADAEVLSRRAEAQYASSARGRAERLLALKAIPRQDYERAITDDDHARAALAQAEAEARRARSTASQLSAGTGASGEILLRAPAAGVVLARTAMPGAVVEAGAPLVVVTDPANLWLTINAPEQMAALFQRGGRLRFSVPAYPSDTFSAVVDAVGAGLDESTRTLGVRAVIANAGRLKPQMLATVVVEGAGKVYAVFVPEDAVQTIDGKSYVFLAKPDRKGGARFAQREVVLGTRSGGRVAILQGLASGDVVVTAGAFAVKAELQKAKMPKMEM